MLDFIGFHTVKRLLERGDSVVGIDVVNDYYDPALKRAPLKAGGRCTSMFADVSLIASSVSYRPQVPVREGVARFVQWYREYTKLRS